MIYDDPIQFYANACPEAFDYNPETDNEPLKTIHESVSTTLTHADNDDKRYGLMYALYLFANKPDQRMVVFSGNRVMTESLHSRFRTALDLVKMAEDTPRIKRVTRNYVGAANDSEIYFFWYKQTLQSGMTFHYRFNDMFQYADDSFKSKLIPSNKIVTSVVKR